MTPLLIKSGAYMWPADISYGALREGIRSAGFSLCYLGGRGDRHGLAEVLSRIPYTISTRRRRAFFSTSLAIGPFPKDSVSRLMPCSGRQPKDKQLRA